MKVISEPKELDVKEGAAGKTPVFGLLKRDGNVYVEIVANCSKEALMSIIQGKVLEGNTINTDG